MADVTLPDAFDVRHHPCGCVTHFDMALWQTVFTTRCSNHAAPESTPTEREVEDVGQIAAVLHEAHLAEFDPRGTGDEFPANQCGNCQRWARYAAPLIAEQRRAAVREWIRAAPFNVLDGIIADAERAAGARALREWIAEWPTKPGDGTFLADVARDGLDRANALTPEKRETEHAHE